MKRPVVLIVGAAAGALLVAGIGASAHTGLSVAKVAGVQSHVFGDEATGTLIETPEPTDSPEPAQAAEPADTDTETADVETDTDTETDEDNGAAAAATTTKTDSGEHDATETKSSSGSTDEKGD
jgi:hypothetical protein